MKKEELENKKIAILGLSREGISSAEYLFRHEIPFEVLEIEDDLEEEKRNLLKKWKCKYILGRDHLKKLRKFDLVLRSPGIPLFFEEIKEAKKQGSKFSSNTKLFMELCPARNVIGVTGTKGKGTTCKLIETVLKKEGKKVFVGGNIGVPPLDFIDQIGVYDYVILELSSFQLEDFEKSPHIVVILGIAPDHLAPESEKAPNYHRSFKDYLENKKNLVRFQKKSDFIVMKNEDENSKSFQKETIAQAFYYSRIGEVKRGAYLEGEKLKVKSEKLVEIGNINEVKLKGQHHLENICAAATVCFLLDCATLSIKEGLFEFAGYEHRLELVGEFGGITYYDDSAATNPEPSIAAIQAFSEPLIVILGGSDKGQNYEKLGEEIVRSSVKVAYLIGDMGSKIGEAIQTALESEKVSKSKLKIVEAGYPVMEKIVKDCVSYVNSGDVVLLSPACASFDMFQNYKDRGNQFKEEVRKQF